MPLESTRQVQGSNHSNITVFSFSTYGHCNQTPLSSSITVSSCLDQLPTTSVPLPSIQNLSPEQQLCRVHESERVRTARQSTALQPDEAHTRTHVYDEFLKVRGWVSEYLSVDNLLAHLWRKTKSESSKEDYLYVLYRLCKSSNLGPDQLVMLTKPQIEALVQNFGDNFNTPDRSIRYANRMLKLAETFFMHNGHNDLKIEGYFMPARYQKMPEYIPRKHEIYDMADAASSTRDKALILVLYSSGFRNSTLRALLHRDVEEELLSGQDNVLLPVYPEMKSTDRRACKGDIRYYSFICDEASKWLRLYIKERRDKHGEIEGTYPLFATEWNQIPQEMRNKTIVSDRELQLIVHSSAKAAGIKQWKAVYPRCLRNAYETVLHSPLIDGTKLDVKIQEFLMGHILPGSQDNYFDPTQVELLRVEYSKLSFGRVIIENRFKTLENAIRNSFSNTGIDPLKVIEDYIKMKRLEHFNPASY